MCVFLFQTGSYGDYSILIGSIKGTDYEGMGPFVVKPSASNYFLCDELCNKTNGEPSDVAYNFLENTYIQTDLSRSFTTGWSNMGSGPMILKTNFALGGGSTPPGLVIFYQRTNYSPVRAINLGIAQTNQNLGTPETAMDAVYSAAKANDLSWYTNLIVASELDLPDDFDFNRGCGTLRQCVVKRLADYASQLNGAFFITSVAYFGPFAVVRTQSEKRPASEEDWLVLKKEGSQWRLSNDLNDGDVVLAYLLGYTSLFSPGPTKVFPTP